MDDRRTVLVPPLAAALEPRLSDSCVFAGAAGDPRRPAPEKASPAPRLSGDHLLIVREAVAETQRACGTAYLAERTLKGEGDHLPMMQAAALAVERVLASRRESAGGPETRAGALTRCPACGLPGCTRCDVWPVGPVPSEAEGAPR